MPFMLTMKRAAPVVGVACATLLASSAALAADNSFNPAIWLILNGTYTNLSKDPGTWQPSGFQPTGGETGPGSRSFSLGETELGLSANIDQYFFGRATVALTPEGEAEVEEGFVQTTALPSGLTARAGRFYSATGYLNDKHAHTWDFVDAPLVHQALFGGQFKQEGVQLKWLAPLDQYLELGAEVAKGQNHPGSERNSNGAGALQWSVHTGGDLGTSHNWRAGVSWLRTRANQRGWTDNDLAGKEVNNTFTGSSRIVALDGVWKWAPHGNAKVTNLVLQGEVFKRVESGQVDYDVDTASAGPAAAAYRSSQSGWYVQGVYQFMPQWRVGLRHDRLDSGSVRYGDNAAYLAATAYSPKRDTVMVDWTGSEYSRIRLQVSDDRARAGGRDTQVFLQYIMSLGAHGAHSY
ncbi:MAG: hypothetical protein RI907_3544 [Pseudomonadota bacterium]|jgi:hypothetical protein